MAYFKICSKCNTKVSINATSCTKCGSKEFVKEQKCDECFGSGKVYSITDGNYYPCSKCNN